MTKSRETLSGVRGWPKGEYLCATWPVAQNSNFPTLPDWSGAVESPMRGEDCRRYRKKRVS